MSDYPQSVIEAARRIGRIFADGCDRGDYEDFELLEEAGLMDRGICCDTFGQDSLEIGEVMWTFNETGSKLVDELLSLNGETGTENSLSAKSEEA